MSEQNSGESHAEGADGDAGARAGAGGNGGAGSVDRGREGALIERGGRGADAVADLLARTRRSATPGPAAAARPVAVAGTAAPPAGPAGDGGDSPGQLDRLASAVVAVAARFLGGAPIDADTDFFDAGATSVAAVEFVAALARELDVRLSLDDVFADARPRRLAQRWLATGAGDLGQSPVIPGPRTEPSALVPRAATLPAPAEPRAQPTAVALPTTARPSSAAIAPLPVAQDEDLAWIAADLARADLLPWVTRPEPLPPRRILLTGATGFLGSHLLLDLLRHSDTHVVCLVRGSDDQDAERRLADGLASFRLPWSVEVRRRVTVVAGDIRQPRLGLTEQRWNSLAADVDSVVSVAAAVDFLRGYPSLRQTNVLGPLALAEFAISGRVKPLHHVSSIAVFNEVGISTMGEDDPLAHVDRLVAGYDKAKWAAEVALRRAREHGLVVTFLRPGGIGGHTHSGAYNPHDLSTGFMSTFTRFRTVPALRFLNVAPVDWVSRMAAAIVCEPDGWGQTYNLVGKPGTLADLVREMQLGGMNVRVQGWDEWRADVLARLDADPVPELDFLRRVLRSPTAVKLCEATLLGPAATGDRAEAFAAAHKLPPPTRYDAMAQLKTVERLASNGLVRLPDRTDPPYLWFPETMVGRVGPVGEPPNTPCRLSMTLSIGSMYQLLRERRVDIRGEVTCRLLHAEPLTVRTGEIWVRPDEGIPRRHGIKHPLLRYRLRLLDRDGMTWWLEGEKTARARRDLWQQARTLAVEIGREGEPASLSGVVVVPGNSYVREQIDGIRVNPDLSPQEQRVAKLMWLAWFGVQMGKGLVEPMLRVGADLLDLRRDAAVLNRERRSR